MFPQSLQTAGLGGLSGTELMVVLAVAVLLFGGKKLGDVGKGLGEGIKNFKDAIKPEDSASSTAEQVRKEEIRREEEIRK